MLCVVSRSLPLHPDDGSDPDKRSAAPVHQTAEEALADSCDRHNRPRLRRKLILAALSSKYPGAATFVSPPGPEDDLSPYESVHSAGMLDFLRSAWGQWERLGEGGRDGDCSLPVPSGAGDDDGGAAPPPIPPLIPCHAPLHRDPHQRPGGNVMGAIGYYCTDQCTPVVSSLLEELRWDASVVRTAVGRAVAGGWRSASYALTTHPGHHAARDNFGGYCYVNHAALAARQMQDLLGHDGGLPKVAVLDVDYHCGNGTVSIFYEDPSVLVVSIHCDPNREYPFNSGFEDQTGSGKGEGTTLHLPLQPGTTWEQGYKGALDRALEEIKKFGARGMIVSLGLDTHAGDKVAVNRAGFNLSCESKDYWKMGGLIGSRAAVPTVFIQEGGYRMDVVGEAAADVVAGFSQA